jgi:hypothetical protein
MRVIAIEIFCTSCLLVQVAAKIRTHLTNEIVYVYEDDRLLDIAQCTFVEADGRFRDTYCLHYQGHCHGDRGSKHLSNFGLLLRN